MAGASSRQGGEGSGIALAPTERVDGLAQFRGRIRDVRPTYRGWPGRLVEEVRLTWLVDFDPFRVYEASPQVVQLQVRRYMTCLESLASIPDGDSHAQPREILQDLEATIEVLYHAPIRRTRYGCSEDLAFDAAEILFQFVEMIRYETQDIASV